MEEAYQMKFTKTVESYESLNQGKKLEQFLFFFKKSGERGKKSMGEKAIMEKTNEEKTP